MLPVIHLQALHFEGKETITIHFPYNKAIDYILKRIKGIKWNISLSCWYLSLDKESYATLKERLNGVATLEVSALKKYLQ